MTSPEPTWPSKGDRVAVVTEGAHGNSVKYGTVTNVTERYVTIGELGKFRRRDLYPVGHGYYAGTVVRVLRPDDPYVADALARIRIRNLGHKVTKVTGGFRGGAAESLAVLDEIEQAVRAARQAMTGKED